MKYLLILKSINLVIGVLFDLPSKFSSNLLVVPVNNIPNYDRKNQLLFYENSTFIIKEKQK